MPRGYTRSRGRYLTWQALDVVTDWLAVQAALLRNRFHELVRYHNQLTPANESAARLASKVADISLKHAMRYRSNALLMLRPRD